MFSAVEFFTLEFESNDPLTFASSGWVFLAFVGGLRVRNLKKLAVQNMKTRASGMVKLLGELLAVEDFRLEHVDLMQGVWPTVMKSIQKMPNLKHLHLFYLSEDSKKCYFLRQPEPEEDMDEESIMLQSAVSPFSSVSGGGDGGGTDLAADAAVAMPEEDNEEAAGGSDDEIPALELAAEAHSGVANANSSAAELPALNPAASPATAPETHEHGSNASHDESQINHEPNCRHFATSSLPESEELVKAHVHSTAQHQDPHACGHMMDPLAVGYYICLAGEQIQSELPTLIKEYNVVDDPDDVMFMNSIMAMMGGTVPPPILANAAAVGGAAAQGGGTQNVFGANNAAGNPHSLWNQMMNGFATAMGPNAPPQNAGGNAGNATAQGGGAQNSGLGGQAPGGGAAAATGQANPLHAAGVPGFSIMMGGLPVAIMGGNIPPFAGGAANVAQADGGQAGGAGASDGGAEDDEWVDEEDQEEGGTDD